MVSVECVPNGIRLRMMTLHIGGLKGYLGHCWNPAQVRHHNARSDFAAGPFSSNLLTMYLLVNLEGKMSEVASMVMKKTPY